MFKDSLCTFVVFCLCKLFCTTYGKFLEIPELPQIACPNYFQYIENGNTYFGKLTLPNIQEGAQVNVEFSLRKELNNVSSLSLDQDEEATSKKIQSGEPISYRVDFPLANVVPKLTQITINGMVICSASEYPSPNTSLKLQHTLRTSVTKSKSGRSKRDTDPIVPTIGQNWRSFKMAFVGSEPQQTTESEEPDDDELVFIPTNRTQSSTPEPKVTEEPMQDEMYSEKSKPIYRAKSSTPQPTQPQEPQETQPQLPQQQILQLNRELQPPLVESVRDTVCGLEGDTDIHFSAFVYGGRPIRRGEYPWLTAIYRKHVFSSTFICGGSLISKNLVLSAAHCFDSLTADKISVTFGRYNLSNSMEDVVSRDIYDIIVNPEYKPLDKRFSDADLALLRTLDIRFTNLIRPICLWPESDDESLIAGQTAMVAGWGTDENDKPSQVPKKVESKIVSDRECLSSSNRFINIITERTLCAGNRDGTGPCHGDSGGGLMVLRNNRWVLRGIVSAGQYEKLRCNLLEYVIFCDVAKHMSWVQRYIE